ncbi:MAG: hypothetical protein QOD00_3989 [Blastocatellia bacterium]|jgi:hypothetical protein|nr:hypothetical protein [Blastocatellia bacterium]
MEEKAHHAGNFLTAEMRVAPGREGEAALPPHLLRLPGGEFALWRCVALRSAGFPAAQVLNFSSPGCTAADELLLAEDEVRIKRSEALSALELELDEAATREQRASLLQAVRRLKKGESKVSPEVCGSARAAIEAASHALSNFETAFLNFRQTYEADAARISQAIRETAGDERFREAIIWQNRLAIHGSIDALRRMSLADTRGAERRKREELVATYLQRYCLKNDTIGFFGPVGWAKLVEEGELIAVRPGPNLLASRQVYFEGWAIDALAEALAKSKALKPFCVPRAMPFARLDGIVLYSPSEAPVRLSPHSALLLRACDGERTAQELAADLISANALGLKNEEEVYHLLNELRALGYISWTVAIPYQLNPEQALRRWCERIGEVRLRRPALKALKIIDAARDAVARASGDSARLDDALHSLEATFTQLTGVASTRAAGRMYASRTLVYEDCRRDVEVEMGPAFLQALGPSLSLLLQSARWFTCAAADTYRATFKQIYDELSRNSDSTIVDLANFWGRARPLLFDNRSSLVHAIQDEFQRRWSDILRLPFAEREVKFRSEELRSLVMAAFGAGQPGWKYARYHSPDVMIAAASPEAIRLGAYQFVIGELHLAGNNVSNWAFVAQHPSPHELLEAIELDLPEPRVVLATPKYWPGMTVRTSLALVSPKDYFLEYSMEPSGVTPSKALPIGEMVVEEEGGALWVRTRDGRLRFEIVEFLSGALSSLLVNSFKILPSCAHTPRLTFDRLIVSRESWTFTPASMEFSYEKKAADRFLAARRWMRAHAMPRFVFVKTPVEVKPFFVDFESQIYIDILARIVRRTDTNIRPDPLLTRTSDPRITVTEMIPGPEQTWLTDKAGERYTSELRMVMVDLAAQNA